MATSLENPFNVTKAVDFTDAEIAANWVDFSKTSLQSLLDFDSTMPRFLVGGKGGGRTHLMRYSSFSLQRIKSQAAGIAVGEEVRQNGYVGIYFRCSGLNSGRFAGKRQDDEVWEAVFGQYMDLWLASLVTDVIRECLSGGDSAPEAREVAAFLGGVMDLFSEPPKTGGSTPQDLVALRDALSAAQGEIDVAVNNAALTGQLSVRIRSNPGALVAGIPQVAARTLATFANIRFVYLIDEFENLAEAQQRYVNTLVREKELPSNFVIGSRRFGVRTLETIGSREVNRQGSEYDQTVMEDFYRGEKGRYEEFCRRLVGARIATLGISATAEPASFFAVEPDESSDPLWSTRALRVLDSQPDGRRRHFSTLASQLCDYGDMSEEVANSVVEALQAPEHPIVEKFRVLEVYRRWSRGLAMSPDEAAEIARSTQPLIERTANPVLERAFRNYRADLMAQLEHENGSRPGYFGLDTFIGLSGYLPRSLLIILKRVTQWSIFLGESPFIGDPISLEAQRRGVDEASQWFLKDRLPLGSIGEDTESGVRRLGSYLRQLRYSHKPVEVSLCAFSTSKGNLTPRALAALEAAAKYDLLVESSSGHRTKNGEDLAFKYQLNPMLAPMFDLPFALRGVIALTSEEVNAIFDPSATEADLRAVRGKRLRSMRVPFGRGGGADVDDGLF